MNEYFNAQNHMEKLELEDLKRIELNILSDIDEFCKENDIKYSLAGGTLLGAVRHKGFIPWDDDIDIVMTRDNYDKFTDLYNKRESKYKLINRHNSKKFNYMFSKVVDTTTDLIEDHNYKVKDMGVFVDIFPIDSLENTFEESWKKIKKTKFKLYVGVASNWRHFYINKSHGFLRQIPRFVFYLLSRISNIKKKYDKIESCFSYDESKAFYGCVCGVYAQREIMPSNVFKDIIEIEFEGKKFMATKEYDEYLKRFYGNYMELPPVDKRITHHTFDAYVKED